MTRHSSYANAVGGSTSSEREAYKAIAIQAKDKRNFLTLRTPKPTTEPNPRSGKHLLQQDQWASLIFEDFGLKVEDVTAVDFHAGGNNAIEIQLKEGVDTSMYEGLSKEKDGMSFQLNKTHSNSTKVTFKSVPLAVPDEELIHLVKAYGGKMDKEEIFYEKVTIPIPGGSSIEIKSTTRFTNATFPPTKRLKTFYWVQGPLPEDPMRRIVAEHAGQVGRQCAYCLKSSADPVDPCPYNGKTAVCKKNNKEGRLPLSRYFALLKQQDNYESLKNQYLWNAEDEELTHQKFSDEYVEAEESVVDTGKEPSAKPEPLSSNWAEETNMVELKAKLEEQQVLLAKEKEENRKIKVNLLKATKNSNNLRKEIKLNKQSVLHRIGETIEDKAAFAEAVDYTSSLLANCLPLNNYKLENNTAVAKSGADPWKEVSDAVSQKKPDQESMTLLFSETMKKMTKKLLEKPSPQRSRSQSRGRSGSEEEEDGNTIASKNAKLEEVIKKTDDLAGKPIQNQN